MQLEHEGHTCFCRLIIPSRKASRAFLKSSIRSCSKRATSAFTRRETWSNSCFASSARRSASPTMVDVLGFLRHTKNALIGNPSAKLALQHTPGPEGPLLPS